MDYFIVLLVVISCFCLFVCLFLFVVVVVFGGYTLAWNLSPWILPLLEEFFQE